MVYRVDVLAAARPHVAGILVRGRADGSNARVRVVPGGRERLHAGTITGSEGWVVRTGLPNGVHPTRIRPDLDASVLRDERSKG